MNVRHSAYLLLLLLFLGGCSDEKKKIPAAEPVMNTQLKIGMQEVHFSQLSEVEGWDFADINQAKALFDYMDDLKVSRFRYTIFWTSAEIGAKNNFDWSRHDELIGYLIGKNIKLTVTLFGDNYLYDSALSSPYPGNAVSGYWDGWLNYIGTAVSRYGDTVDRWEIWNEPDLGTSASGVFWKPGVNAADFTAMLKGTAQKIKSVHPGANVVLGGVTTIKGYRAFLASCFDAGILDYIDEVGFHFYRLKPEGPFNLVADDSVDMDPGSAGVQLPATFADEVSSLRSFVDGYKTNFPISNTEEGFYNVNAPAREDLSQMKYLTRTILVEHSLGIEETLCFRLRAPRRSDFPAGTAGDSAYSESLKFPGIIDQSDADGSFTPRAAYYGIKNMAQYLVGSDVYYQRSFILNSSGYTVRVEIYDKKGLPVVAYWIEEAIDNTDKAIRNIPLTIDGIGVHSYKVTDIKKATNPAVGSYSGAGTGVSFSSLPVTDYPFILSVQ